MSRLLKRYYLLGLLSLLTAMPLNSMITSLNKTDPFPVYTTLDPHTFNHRGQRELLHNNPEERWSKPEHVRFSASFFGQNAYFGKNIKRNVIPTCDVQPEKVCVELGDMLESPWNMIPLVYGNLPEGRTLGPVLSAAQAGLFPGGEGLNSSNNIDPDGKLGFFSFPAEYRKRGVRFEFDGRIFRDFGVKLQGGVSDICFSILKVINLNEQYVAPTMGCSLEGNVSKETVNQFLMCKLKEISQELGISLESFNETAVEDFRFFGYWRHAWEVNAGRVGWPHFLVIPHFQIGSSIGVGKPRDPRRVFSLPFGNNGHNSLGFNVGLNLDFTESLEFGAEAGMTHFFSRCIQGLRVPNSLCQSGIYPFATDVSYRPGRNVHFGAKMNAYHFVDRLSFYFQYLFINHDKDKICLQQADPAFTPSALEQVTNWKTHLANIGFNYDLSPNIALGFLWQAPLMQQNVFRSTTLMFSFIATF